MILSTGWLLVVGRDFDLVRVIGQGSFGRVFLVRRVGMRSSGEDGQDTVYAMKVGGGQTPIPIRPATLLTQQSVGHRCVPITRHDSVRLPSRFRL